MIVNVGLYFLKGPANYEVMNRVRYLCSVESVLFLIGFYKACIRKLCGSV